MSCSGCLPTLTAPQGDDLGGWLRKAAQADNLSLTLEARNITGGSTAAALGGGVPLLRTSKLQVRALQLRSPPSSICRGTLPLFGQGSGSVGRTIAAAFCASLKLVLCVDPAQHEADKTETDLIPSKPYPKPRPCVLASGRACTWQVAGLLPALRLLEGRPLGGAIPLEAHLEVAPLESAVSGQQLDWLRAFRAALSATFAPASGADPLGTQTWFRSLLSAEAPANTMQHMPPLHRSC